MTIAQIKELLEATVLTGEDKLHIEVNSACGSDMMSDVLAYVKDHSILLTGLINPQVIRTAEMMDMRCIVFVRGKVPEQVVLDLAKEKGFVVLATKQRLYTACGILYLHGLRGAGCDKV